MECKKCKKQFDDEFLFCPYCGLKVESLAEKLSFNNAEFLAICREEDFEKEYLKFSKMSTSEAYHFFHEMHDLVVAYRFKVTGTHTDYNIEGKCRGTDFYDKSFERRGMRKEDLADYICSVKIYRDGSKTKYRNVNISAEPFFLKKSYFKEIGKSVFWTEEDCKNAIIEVARDLGNLPENYDCADEK